MTTLLNEQIGVPVGTGQRFVIDIAMQQHMAIEAVPRNGSALRGDPFGCAIQRSITIDAKIGSILQRLAQPHGGLDQHLVAFSRGDRTDSEHAQYRRRQQGRRQRRRTFDANIDAAGLAAE